MPPSRVTVVIPTLVAGETLRSCLDSLENQTWRDFEVIVVDNSGRGLARESAAARPRIIENQHNAGFGVAVNQGIQASASELVATLNDDAQACPEWLEALVEAMDGDPRAGMCASCVLFFDQDRLDSAGMLLAGDGSSKQRGHGAPPRTFGEPGEALLPSGSAAMYRRKMLVETGGFDDRFFLYCEDTDLGLRAQWLGWTCRYAPRARVRHHYSRSAGAASKLKAYYVERNRLFVVAKNFPASMLWRAPFAEIARYRWHVVALFSGRGAGAAFQRAGHGAWRLPLYVFAAHLALLWNLPWLLRERTAVMRSARISAAEFSALARRHSIGVKEVALL